jgi:GxxExxY protein
VKALQVLFTAEDAEDRRGVQSEVLHDWRAVFSMHAFEINVRTGQVVDAAMRVHSKLGPGLLESAYEACLAYELRKRGRSVLVQHPLPVAYDDVRIDVGYRADLLVDAVVVVELKAIAKLMPIHDAQLLSYLKLTGIPAGSLINFHVQHLKDGIERIVNNL